MYNCLILGFAETWEGIRDIGSRIKIIGLIKIMSFCKRLKALDDWVHILGIVLSNESFGSGRI